MPESTKTYEPLSGLFQNAGLAAHQSGPSVFRRWFAQNGGDKLNGRLIDEGEIFDAVEELLAPGALEFFLYLPPAVARLQEAYEAIREEREAYLRHVLSVQRGKILRTLERFRDKKIEKRIGNINRGIRRRADKHVRLVGEIEKKRADMLGRAIQGGIRRMVQDTFPEMAAMAETAGFSDMMGKGVADLRRQADAVIGGIGRLIRERLILEIELTTQEEIRDLLRRTEERLVGLGGSLDIAPASEVNRPMGTPTASTPPLGVCRTVGKVKTRGTAASPTDTDAGTRAEAQLREDGIDRSLRLIKELIKTSSTRGFTRIRILIGDTRNMSRRTRQRNWEELIEAMGFRGRIEFVNHKRLAATRDVDSPVIVPYGLYTHTSSWSPQRFSTLRVLSAGSPRSLRGRLASSHPPNIGDI